MAVRRATGIFRPGPSNSNPFPNIVDHSTVTSTPVGWTQGATLIDIISPNDLVPRPGKNFTILSLSVSGQLALILSPGASKFYGKFGNIVIGLPMTPDGSANPTGYSGAGNPPYSVPVLPLPSDLSLVSPLWTPDSDPLPPISQANFLSVYASIDLSLPLLVTTGIQPVIGIWMLPSLLSSQGTFPTAALALYNSTYNVVYDDLSY